MQNTPDLWLHGFPKPVNNTHKYDRGHALILGSQSLTGATRLAGMACARIGAGLVSVVGGKKADVYRGCLPAHILVLDAVPKEFKKISSFLNGPGGNTVMFRKKAEIRCAVVLDAQAITEYREYKSASDIVLTPHEGEFSRMFPDLEGAREERALKAAIQTNSIIVLKGHKTVIASPDGASVINDMEAPYLATAGTGDVLAGLITGLTTQGMPAFHAACAAVWIHTKIGAILGAGMVADDMPDKIPSILKELGL